MFTASDTEVAQVAKARLTARYGTVEMDRADVIVALGGDGFMLQTLHATEHRDVPVYGMNCGTIGFLMNEFSEDDLDLRLDEVRPDGPVGFELTTAWEQVPDARIRLAGEVGPLFPAAGKPTSVHADVAVEHVDTERLVELVRAVYPLPVGLVAGRNVSVSASLDGNTGPAPRWALSNVVVEGLGVSLVQDANGRWNLPVTGPATASGMTHWCWAKPRRP